MFSRNFPRNLVITALSWWLYETEYRYLNKANAYISLLTEAVLCLTYIQIA